MNKITSYRTKRRRIQEELKLLESSDSNNSLLSNTYFESSSPNKNFVNDLLCIDKVGEIINVNCNNNDQLQTFLNENLTIVSQNNPCYNKNEQLKQNIRNWVINYNIPQNASNALLNILINDADLSFLPKNSRTLLNIGSTKVLGIQEMTPNGYYYHFGLKEQIIHCSNLFPLNEHIKIAIGIDGLPLSKSSSSQFWPILGYIVNSLHPYVFPIGIYYGYHKPHDSNEFLKYLLSDILELSKNGIVVNNLTKQVSIQLICCDAPAKAFILRIKGHTGMSSCTRCTIEGEYLQNRVCFPFNNNYIKKTHADYVSMKYDEHHTNTTISCLSIIPDIDMVNVFSMDYMHLVCLGCVKKLIILWQSKGPLKVRLPSWKMREITNSLLKMKVNVTSDFSRKPRSIEEVGRWKATEFRQFLLYTGPIVLKNMLTDDCYEHFMALSVALRILLSLNYEQYVEYSKKLIAYFVQKFEELYGRHFISHNIHGLIHLPDDYYIHGPLDHCSAFPFENYMKQLKKMLRKHEKPLQQVVRRYEEYCKSGQFNYDNSCKIKYSNKVPDCYVLTCDGDVVRITNVPKLFTPTQHFEGQKFMSREDMFITPIKSSRIGLFNVGNLSKEIKSWKMSDIKNKIMIFNINNQLIAQSIIHTTV